MITEMVTTLWTLPAINDIVSCCWYFFVVICLELRVCLLYGKELFFSDGFNHNVFVWGCLAKYGKHEMQMYIILLLRTYSVVLFSFLPQYLFCGHLKTLMVTMFVKV